MRYFHKQQNHFWKPIINLDKVLTTLSTGLSPGWKLCALGWIRGRIGRNTNVYRAADSSPEKCCRFVRWSIVANLARF
jgi:hypothetical protein